MRSLRLRTFKQGGADVVDVGNLTPGQGPLDEEQPDLVDPFG